MPDREAHKEWGRLGSLSVRMLRKGFRIPPTGAFGVTQVQEWLESFSTYPAAIQAWRNWEDVEAALEPLRREIENTPMPAHWPLSCETLRRHLCGDQDWPLMLRPTFKRPQYEPAALHAVIAPSPSSENVWDAFKKLFLHIFTLPMAREIVLAGTDPAELRISIVVQPEIVVNRDSALSLEAERDLKLKQKIAEKFLEATHTPQHHLGWGATLVSRCKAFGHSEKYRRSARETSFGRSRWDPFRGPPSSVAA